MSTQINKVVDALSRVSNIPGPEIHGIFQQVLDNTNRLNGCTRHCFTCISAIPMRRKYQCAICKGTIDAIAHHWYVQGLRDASPGPI